MDGRYWLRLEWRALARALQESGAARVDAVRDALAFRQARRALYAGSAEDERRWRSRKGSRTTRASSSRHRLPPTRSRARSINCWGGRDTGQRRSDVPVDHDSGLWPSARCLVGRVEETSAQHRRHRHAPDACALRSTGRQRRGVGRAVWGCRDPPVRGAARAAAPGPSRGVATAVHRRSRARDAGKRQRRVQFHGCGGDSRKWDRVLWRLQGVRPVGDARCGERRAGCDRWQLASCVGTRAT